MVVVGRDLWTSSGQTPLLKQSQLEIVFEDVWGWRLYHFSRQYVPGHPHSEKVLPGVSVCAHCLFPWHRAPMKKSLTPSPSHLPCRYLDTLMTAPWTSPRLTVFSSKLTLDISCKTRYHQPYTARKITSWTFSEAIDHHGKRASLFYSRDLKILYSTRQKLCSSEQPVLHCCDILLWTSGHILPQGVNISFGLAERASVRNIEVEARTCPWSRGDSSLSIFFLQESDFLGSCIKVRSTLWSMWLWKSLWRVILHKYL